MWCTLLQLLELLGNSTHGRWCETCWLFAGCIILDQAGQWSCHLFALSKLTTWHRETQKYQKSDPLRCQLIIVAYSGHAMLMQQVLSRFEGGWVQLSRCQVHIAQSRLDGNDLRAPDQLTHVNNFADWLCSSLPSILIKNELDISFVYLCLNLYLCICIFVVCVFVSEFMSVHWRHRARGQPRSCRPLNFQFRTEL